MVVDASHDQRHLIWGEQAAAIVIYTLPAFAILSPSLLPHSYSSLGSAKSDSCDTYALPRPLTFFSFSDLVIYPHSRLLQVIERNLTPPSVWRHV